MSVSILGSCVTRDTAEYWPPGWNLLSYHARHPLGSFPYPSELTDADVHAQPKGWRRVQHVNDITSATVDVLVQQEPDLILWDLADERLGVHQRPDGGWAAGEGVPYWTEQYKSMWADGVALFMEAADGIPVVLNAAEWDRSSRKSTTFHQWQAWAVQVASSYGVAVAVTDGTRSGPEHRWGDAPFHMRPFDYRRMVVNMQAALEREQG